MSNTFMRVFMGFRQVAKSIPIIAFLGLVASILFIPYFTERQSFVTFLSFSGLSALKYQMAQSFFVGEYPLWNPYSIAGTPFQFGIGIPDPFLLLWGILGNIKAILAQIYLALLLAGIFMFVYLRTCWKLPLLSSLLGAALYLTKKL